MGERMRGIDAAFLSIETPTSPMHTGVLAVLDPTTAPGRWSFESVVAMVSARLHLAPLFRRRVVEVPFGLHHPLWYDDPDFDIANHVRRLHVDPPAGEEELTEAVAAVMAAPLARGRPLWALHVADGLAGGRAAVLGTSHHAANDGVSGTEVLVRLLDLDPVPTAVEPAVGPWCPPPLPGDAELIGDALSALAARRGEAANAVRGTVELLSRLRRHLADPETGAAPAPFRAPRTSLNTVLAGSERRVALVELPLGDVLAVRARFGVTVNDVVLALCAGALRVWMAERGEVPGGDLVALVPASLRTPTDGISGNRVSPMLVSLATGVEDPVDRLAAIASSARAAKAQEREVGSAVLADWAEVAPPAVVTGAVMVASALGLAGLVPPAFNVSVSNLAGPPVPLYMAGARVVAAFPLGPVADGSALNITVLSYSGTLGFGLVADRASVPTLDTIAGGLADSLGELTKAPLR